MVDAFEDLLLGGGDGPGVYHDTPLFRATLAFLERKLSGGVEETDERGKREEFEDRAFQEEGLNEDRIGRSQQDRSKERRNQDTEDVEDGNVRFVKKVTGIKRKGPGKGFRYCELCGYLNHVRKARCGGCERERPMKKRRRTTVAPMTSPETPALVPAKPVMECLSDVTTVSAESVGGRRTGEVEESSRVDLFEDGDDGISYGRRASGEDVGAEGLGGLPLEIMDDLLAECLM